jgi:FtsZ-binding cell division protein ZapB
LAQKELESLVDELKEKNAQLTKQLEDANEEIKDWEIKTSQVIKQAQQQQIVNEKEKYEIYLKLKE